MKKALTIGGAVLGFLLISALVIFIFFPGLPTYIKVKHKYKHIDEKVPVFEAVSAGADFKEYTIKGVKLKAPGDWELKESGNGIASSSLNASLFLEALNYEDYYASYDSELGYDPWTSYNYTEDDYKHFFNTLGIKTNPYDLSDNILWYIRDSFTAKDCLKLRSKDRKVFAELAESKEAAYQEEKMWKIKNDSYTGYVGQFFAYGYTGNMWTFTFFPVGDEVNKYSIMMKCPDETIAKQIISSIELE
ncbi:hypothetical protein [Ruminococcus flavefaciens]|uniref:Uncharacterized protein n=1 Tax=Ruminococcus flavefaciens TaxID=1265 RepID=A0A1M7GHV8_RUMFL|nr:hypothetical protein [Ruminococcus flavefaciens]SHM15801.1 hypothetical protein SAMN04487860_101311 [Ruminococcus flavefaciens]